MVSGGIVISSLATLVLLTGLNFLQGNSFVIILAPLTFLLAADYEAAVVLPPKKELTHTWDVTMFAKHQVGSLIAVEVVDSRAAGPAQGFLAIAAARVGAAGATLETVLEAIELSKQYVGLVTTPNTLEFLVAGGHVKAAQDWMASVLRISPVVTLTDGQINLLGMART